MNKIIIKNAQFLCNVGITQEERAKKQKIILDITMFCDTQKSTKTDDIKDTIDYFQVHQKIKNLIENKKFNLLEKMADVVADCILENFNIQKIKILIKKPNAIKNSDYCGIEIEKSCQ